MDHVTQPRRQARAALVLTALLVLGLFVPQTAGAHPSIPRWWQYDKYTWTHSWRSRPKLRREHARWHNRHPYASARAERDTHRWLTRQFRAIHFHRAISFQSGQASWYRGGGLRGACGKPLVGLYAASQTLPCGSLVSVRSGGRYVLVRILDRGPYGSSSRILDLSPRAFRQLSPPGAGVISVKAVRLRP